jgi:hypothetical protein
MMLLREIMCGMGLVCNAGPGGYSEAGGDWIIFGFLAFVAYLCIAVWWNQKSEKKEEKPPRV